MRGYRASPDGAARARTRVLEEALSVMLRRDMFSPEAQRLAQGVLDRDPAVVAEVRRLFAEDRIEGMPDD